MPRTHTPDVTLILRAWDSATAADLAEGLAWYERAAQLADALSAGTPFTRNQCAGVIAALSPRVTWDLNIRAAAQLVDAAATWQTMPDGPGLGANRRKAWRILHGETPDAVLSGPKVRAFFANIIGETEPVTVDVWAARAALGYDLPSFGPAAYARIELAYRNAASIIGHTPRDVQAAVWVYTRRTWEA